MSDSSDSESAPRHVTALAEPSPPTPPAPTEASYFEKLLAYIPSELVGSYVCMDGILKEASVDKPLWLYWAIFGALLTLAPLYVLFRPTTNTVLKCTQKFRAITATVALTVWVFAMGGPFAITFDWYRPVYGAVLLILTTLAIPVFEKIAERFKF